MKFYRVIACASFAFTHLALASVKSDSVLDDSLQLALSQEALGDIGQHIQEQYLRGEESASLDDTEDSILGVTFKSQDAHYMLQFKNFSIRLREDGALDLHVDLSDIKVKIDRLSFSKKILGATLSATCEDTTIQFGHQEDIPVRTRLHLRAENQSIWSQMDEISLKINSDNFRIGGPRRCTGKLGVGYLIRGTVRLILDQSYKQIEKRIKEALARSGARVGDELTKIVLREIKLDPKDIWPGMSSEKNKSLTIQTFPTDLNINQQRLLILFGTQWASSQKNTARKLEKRDNNNEPAYARLGINPKMLTHFFETLRNMAGGELSFPVASAETPLLGEILTRERLATIWPDLLNRELSSENLAVQLSLSDSPELHAHETQNDQLRMIFPRLVMRFWTHEKGEKLLFFTMYVRLEFSMKAEMSDGYLTFVHTSDPEIQISGSWGDNVNPQIQLFEQDQASVLISTAVQYFKMQDLRWPLPALHFGEHEWSWTNGLSIQSDFWELTVEKSSHR